MDELIDQWKVQSKEQKDENNRFLKNVWTIPKAEFLPKLQETHQEAFQKIDCLSCANCCKTTPAIITKGDASRIAKHMNIAPKQFIRQYVIEDINGDMMLNGVPCRFLNDDNSCSIYDVRPEACRRYPHTDEAEYPNRTSLNLANTIVCPAAYYIVERLKTQFPAI